MQAVARAHPNIALVKYWGKRDPGENLPAMSSLSLTLRGMQTITRVEFLGDGQPDELFLNGRPAREAEVEKVRRVLDRIRRAAGLSRRARVETENSFPTAAGLASSASGFAALALAASRAAGLPGGLAEWAVWARIGSGSAPRSLLGGFVELRAGERPDGSDCLPVQVAPEDFWDVRLVVAETTEVPKEVGSTAGMLRTERTSPFYGAWTACNDGHVRRAREAIRSRDLGALGAVMEASALAMHATMMTAEPPLLYWNGATVEGIHRVWELRRQGIEGYLTIDAGPHLKVLCRAEDAEALASEIRRVPGVVRVLIESPGPGAEVLA